MEKPAMKHVFLILLAICLVTGCSKPISYYTNPASAGYNQQKLGGICEHCGRQFNLSGYQLHNVKDIKCPYCSNYSNTQNSAVSWVSTKNQLDEQANQEFMLSLIQGAVSGLESYNKGRYTSPPSTFTDTNPSYTGPITTYQASGCTSDFSCGIGNRCVKATLQSHGICMKSVNEYGLQSYDAPSLDSVGVNMNLDGQCSLDTDCPIGFRCDRKYKSCVKR